MKTYIQNNNITNTNKSKPKNKSYAIKKEGGSRWINCQVILLNGQTIKYRVQV